MEALQTNWYQELIQDIRRLEFTVIEAKHAIGRRILADFERFGKPEYGSKRMESLATDTGISIAEIYRCKQFAEKYPELPDFITRDKIAWRVIVQKYLPASSRQETKNADDIPEKIDVVTKPDDMWHLGRHRLLCADSREQNNIERLLNGQKADMVFTDPPYGLNTVKNKMVGADFGIAEKGKYKPIKNDDNIMDISFVLKLASKTLVWGGNYFAPQLPVSGSWFVWDKRGDTGIKNTFADCELAWSNFGNPARVIKQLWNGMIREGESGKRVHPTQKPINLFVEIIDSQDCNLILDPFLGSGSTLIACEKTGRTCYGMEIDPHYCDVTVNRYREWCEKNGKPAEISRNAGNEAQQEPEPAQSYFDFVPTLEEIF